MALTAYVRIARENAASDVDHMPAAGSLITLSMVRAGKTLRAPREFLRARLRADDGAKILAPIRASKQKLLVGIGSDMAKQLHWLALKHANSLLC